MIFVAVAVVTLASATGLNQRWFRRAEVCAWSSSSRYPVPTWSCWPGVSNWTSRCDIKSPLWLLARKTRRSWIERSRPHTSAVSVLAQGFVPLQLMGLLHVPVAALTRNVKGCKRHQHQLPHVQVYFYLVLTGTCACKIASSSSGCINILVHQAKEIEPTGSQQKLNHLCYFCRVHTFILCVYHRTRDNKIVTS
jgi:hypothetical protein